MVEGTGYRVKLDVFEGPLDLLLYLIRKNQIDIYDIPIAEITQQYLDMLDLMRTLNLDVAGEFLVMAATLTHIKSKMLLPSPPDSQGDEEEEDPRKELVDRLLEYERYKEAAISLESHEILERDVFARKVIEDEQDEELELSIFELIEALQEVLKRSPHELVHEITLERISIEEKITQILDKLTNAGGEVEFTSLFEGEAIKEVIIITFLAVLELVQMRLIKIYQQRAFRPIKIRKI
ncbi:MAG: segregation/condensation protein A [Proteobacteria bacterium]|nr:segregation/condensation protein A [Pseudomonadota bacterium]NIS71841.1 segregation/condensation protein A [Pseudomonadota bacterium]